MWDISPNKLRLTTPSDHFTRMHVEFVNVYSSEG